MNILFKSFFLICLWLIPSLAQAQAFTETHYVTQSGAGSKTGQSLATAWALSDFHNSNNWSTNKAVDGKIGPGDVVYFSGTFTDRVIVTNGGSSAESITLDGYEAGECDPLNSVCTGSALLQQGMEIGNRVAGPDYLTIQDFRMTRDDSSHPCFRILGKRDGTEDEQYINRLLIRRNHIFETNGTMFYWRWGRYNIIEDNKFVHFGQNNTDATQGVNFIQVENSLVRRNEFGHREDLYPSGCKSANIIEVHAGDNLLFEYNNLYGAPNGTNIAPKEGWGGNSNIVIRFNKVHGSANQQLQSGGKGIYFRTRDHEMNENFYCYGNNVYGNDLNIALGDVMTNLYIWSNLSHSALRTGILAWNSNIDGMHIYNNTIAKNNTLGHTDLTRGGISLSASSSTYHIKNNIFWNNRPGGERDRRQIYTSQVINSLEHNIYYHDLGAPTIYYDGATRSIDVMKSVYGFENQSPSGEVVDPRFNKPAGSDGVYGTAYDNYTLAANSPAIGAGIPLSGRFSVNLSGGDSWFEAQTGYSILTFGLDDALCPIGTDWTTNPPTVVTAKQGANGSGWDLGAYVYRNSNEKPLAPPKIIDIQDNLN